jgi:hypothetical protein
MAQMKAYVNMSEKKSLTEIHSQIVKNQASCTPGSVFSPGESEAEYVPVYGFSPQTVNSKNSAVNASLNISPMSCW